MLPADLPAVFALQCRAYPADYHEPLEALASHLSAGPDFCCVAQRGERLLAYVFAHPWVGDPPALHLPVSAAEEADHVFLHDLAVCPGCRGMSVGHQLYAAVRERAERKGFARIRLVSLAAAQPFWRRTGFSVSDGIGLGATYGDAMVMSQQLALQA